MRYVKAERLKYKNAMINRLLWIAPVITLAFAFLTTGIQIYQSASIYWWYVFIIQGLIGVLCLSSVRAEEKSGYKTMIYSLPVNLRKVRYAHNIILIWKLTVAEIVFSILLYLVPLLLFPDYLHYGIGKILLGSLIVIITSAWQIPFCLILMRKIGSILTIVANVAVGTFMIPLLGNTPFWILFPYCWTAKEMQVIFHIGINGVVEENVQQFNQWHIAAIAISIIFLLILMKLDAFLFEKKDRV